MPDKYSGPRLTLPLGSIKVHAVTKLLVGYSVQCSLFNSSGDRVPITIQIPLDSADIRPNDTLTLYTEVATRATT